NYDGKVTITGGGSTLSIAVSLSVQGVNIAVSPASLAFSLPQGKSDSKTFAISQIGGSGANVTIAVSGGSWLTVDKTSTAAPNSITVTVATSALATNSTYNGSIRVSCSASPCIPQTVSVTLIITVPPSLKVSPPTLSFTAFAGGANPS